MPKLIGRRQAVGIAKEDPRGTFTAPAFWLPVETKKLNPNVALKELDGAYGNIEKSVGTEIVTEHSEPEFGGILFDRSIGLLFLATLGQVSTTPDSPEVGVNTHTFTVKNDNLHPALSIGLKDDNISKAAILAVLNSLGLDMVIDDFVRFTAGFMAKQVTDQTLTPSFTEENPFLPRHAIIKIADNLAGLDAALPIDIQNISMEIPKNVEILRKFGANDAWDSVNKEFEITGSFSAIIEDTSYLDLFLGNTKKALRIEMENTDVTIGAISHPKITIDLAQVNLNPWSQDNANADIIRQTVEFRGHFLLSAAKAIEVKLINVETSY